MRPADILVWGAAAALATALISQTGAQLPGLTTVGAITAGHCSSFASPSQIQDAGAPCLSNPLTGTSPQLTLGANGGNGGGLQLNGSTSGNTLISANATGTLNPLTFGANGGATGTINLNGSTSGAAVLTGGTTGSLNVTDTAGATAALNIGTDGSQIGNVNLSGNTSGHATLAPRAAAAGTVTLPNGPATLLSTAGQIVVGAPGNPTGTASATNVMMGLGSACSITPTYSTRVMLFFVGFISNSGASGGFYATPFYGTGAAPANGAAATGTSTQTPVSGQDNANGAAQLSPFMVMAPASGLTPGTAYWYDLALRQFNGGTASMGNITCWAFEI